MESKIKNLHRQDNATVVFILVVLWAVLVYVISQVMGIAPDRGTSLVIAGIGVIAGSFATAACIAVLVHLKKNKIKLYTEEINAMEGNDANEKGKK